MTKIGVKDPLTIGARVTWTSQSAGVTKTKAGVVEVVVPAGEKPAGIRNPGTSRDHVSYLVRADHGRLYWPRVKHLELAPATGAEILALAREHRVIAAAELPAVLDSIAEHRTEDRDRLGIAAEALVRALWLYPHYRLDSRGPLGCIVDALKEIAPDVAAELGEHDASDVYAKHWPDEETP